MPNSEFKPQEMIPYDYVWMNGKTMPPVAVDAYNRYTADINRERNPDNRKILLDHRHQYLCTAIGVQGF